MSNLFEKTLNCKPIAHIDSFTTKKLRTEAKCEEVTLSEGAKIIEIIGVPNDTKTVSILCRGANQLVLDETERSLHDSLCVVRSIIKKSYGSRGIYT